MRRPRLLGNPKACATLSTKCVERRHRGGGHRPNVAVGEPHVQRPNPVRLGVGVRLVMPLKKLDAQLLKLDRDLRVVLKTQPELGGGRGGPSSHHAAFSRLRGGQNGQQAPGPGPQRTSHQLSHAHVFFEYRLAPAPGPAPHLSS